MSVAIDREDCDATRISVKKTVVAHALEEAVRGWAEMVVRARSSGRLL